MRRLRTLAAFLGVLLSGASTGLAQVVFSSGAPDQASGLAINLITGGTANDFTLPGAFTLTSFQWYVLHPMTGSASITSSFLWSILIDANGSPGAALASGAVSNASGASTQYKCCGSSVNFDVYRFDAGFGNLSLTAGTYWLAITNYTSPNNAFNPSYWASSNGRSGNEMVLSGPLMGRYQQEGAFTVYGVTTTPEPGSLALAVTGLLGILGWRLLLRRRGSTE